MRNLRKLLIASLVVAAIGTVQAQPDEDPPRELGSGTDAKLSPREMTNQTEALLADMQQVLRRVLEIQQSARKQKDIIKLNCVNDKLLQVKQLLNIAEGAKTEMVEAIASNSEADRYHQFARVTVASDKTKALRDEAEACVGEELAFVGDSQLEVDKPPIVDDPTYPDPFDLGGIEIERPTYATPFL